jgi:hypothetical protein
MVLIRIEWGKEKTNRYRGKYELLSEGKMCLWNKNDI